MTNSFVYTAIGDSLTFGTGAKGFKGFTTGIRSELKKMHPVLQFHPHGVVGATTSDTLERLLKNDQVREHIADSHLITVTVGGNDLIKAAISVYIEGAMDSMKPPMRKFAETFDSLIAELVKVNHPAERGGRIVVADCYNPFPQIKDAVLWVNFLNRCIYRTASNYKGQVWVAPVYEAFIGKEVSLLSDDGVHPNDQGHTLLCACMKKRIL